MKRLFKHLFISMLLSPLVTLPLVPCARAMDLGNIWLLGDSITYGAGCAGGYRDSLYTNLLARGCSFKFVGTVASNSTKRLSAAGQAHHDGHSGYSIANAMDISGKPRAGIYEGIESWHRSIQKPDLILLMIGINDLNTGYKIDTASERLDRLVARLFSYYPHVRLLIASLPDADPNNHHRHGATNDLTVSVRNYNAEMVSIVAKHRAMGQNISWVDMHAKLSLADLHDGLHPSAEGYVKMGNAWASAIVSSLRLPPAAAPSSVIDLWPPGKMPGDTAAGLEHQMPPQDDNAERITDISRPTLGLCLLPGRGKPMPAMIVCPGGGYRYVVYDKEGTEIAAWLNSIGIEALVLKYRVPNNRAGAFQDVQRAISLARSHAAEWNIDPKRLGIIGFSAGGNLAAKASTLFGERSYAAVDSADQFSCRPNFVVLVYPAYLEGKSGQVSPDLNLKANIPPTLIIHNDDDSRFVRGSKLYHAALDAAGIPNTLILYRTGGHGYGLRSDEDVRVWPQAAEKWLRQTGVLAADSERSAMKGRQTNSIVSFGAVGDGKTLNTHCIQTAIDQLAAKGGGTLVIPKGVFLSGAIFLKPGINLSLEKGAVLKGSTNITDYPEMKTRIEGHFTQWLPALINADKTDHLTISGQGTLDGNGAPFWKRFWARLEADPRTTNLDVKRPRLVFIQDSEDVRINGVTFENSAYWNLHLYRCQNVTVQDVRFLVPQGVRCPSTDGTDVDSSQNVTIQDCTYRVNDDCIALKGSKGPFALDDKDSLPVKHIRVVGCTFERGNGAVTLGSEATRISDVTVEHCRVLGSVALVCFKLRSDTPQDYEDVHYRDITLDGTGEILRVKPWMQYYNLQGQSPPDSIVRGISLSDIKGRYGSFGTIEGNPGQTRISDISLENMDVQLDDGHLDANSVKNLTINHVMINGKLLVLANRAAPLAPQKPAALLPSKISNHVQKDKASG